MGLSVLWILRGAMQPTARTSSFSRLDSRYHTLLGVRWLQIVRQILFSALAALLLSTAKSPQEAIQWQHLQPGVELAVIGARDPLYVVRIDPRRARLQAALASESGAPRTAGAWCKAAGLSVAINLGMFQSDGRSNVGYLRNASHVNNGRWNAYRSALALNPKDASKPPLLWRDLDQASSTPDLKNYGLVVQNLRLIAGDRKNVWAASDKRWSEAAIAADSHYRLLFLFTRTPHTMRDFNDLILGLPLDITRAMHVEGGPEASLSIHTAAVSLDLCGSYETGFRLDDSNQEQWPIPNVLGVLKER
jgi:hypothetical protein